MTSTRNANQPLPYDEALYASWHQYMDTPAEREERDATMAGVWPVVEVITPDDCPGHVTYDGYESYRYCDGICQH